MSSRETKGISAPSDQYPLQDPDGNGFSVGFIPGCLSKHNLLDDKYVYRLRMMSGSLSKAMEQGCWCELQSAYLANWNVSKMFIRAVLTDILDFAARVLVRQAATSCNAQLLRSRAGFCRATRATCDSPVLRAAPPWRFGRTVGQHSVVIRPRTAEGHISHDADRLVSTRVRRAAAARDCRSAGTASPVPKYISSGVCRETPNAEAHDCVGRRRTRPVDAPC